DVHTYSATGPIEQILPLIGQGLAPGTPQPEVGPLDPRTGYPTYYSDGYNALELCLDNTPPNGPNGLPLPQTYDPVARVWSPTMCLAPAPDADKNRPPSITLNAATTNWGAEGFYWYGGADATPTGWTRALLVLAQEAADEPMLAGQQWMFGRLRLRADGVPPGTYRFTHPFGSDIVTVAVGDDRVFETSDIGCMTTPCDFT